MGAQDRPVSVRSPWRAPTSPPTRTLRLAADPVGEPLKAQYSIGFEYSDCWADDARLVVLNARDAADMGAVIAPRTRCVNGKREGGLWTLTLLDELTGRLSKIRARTLVNAAGPWVNEVLRSALETPPPAAIRLVKGSHVVVRRLFEHDKCYIFQNIDRRVLFVMPFERDYTLIGTTDLDYNGDLDAVKASAAEIEYLCGAASNYFRVPITASEVLWSYSGVRPLYDDGASEAQEATRDYVLKLDESEESPALLSIFGGKITTYRRLAEAALAILSRYLPPARRPPGWTALHPLPGGDFPTDGFETLVGKTAGTISILAAPDSSSSGPRLWNSRGGAACRRKSPVGSGTDVRSRPDRGRSALSRQKRVGDDGYGCRMAALQARAAHVGGRG